jgi:hypothetical protein
MEPILREPTWIEGARKVTSFYKGRIDPDILSEIKTNRPQQLVNLWDNIKKILLSRVPLLIRAINQIDMGDKRGKIKANDLMVINAILK